MLCSTSFRAGGPARGAEPVRTPPGGVRLRELEDIGHLFSAHAALWQWPARSTRSNLRTAVTNRDVIGQAKGILMERHKLTADQAFGVLARASQEMNRKLVDIARELAHTGAVPAAHLRRR